MVLSLATVMGGKKRRGVRLIRQQTNKQQGDIIKMLLPVAATHYLLGSVTTTLREENNS